MNKIQIISSPMRNPSTRKFYGRYMKKVYSDELAYLLDQYDKRTRKNIEAIPVHAVLSPFEVANLPGWGNINSSAILNVIFRKHLLPEKISSLFLEKYYQYLYDKNLISPSVSWIEKGVRHNETSEPSYRVCATSWITNTQDECRKLLLEYLVG